jgi:hypothetical protein
MTESFSSLSARQESFAAPPVQPENRWLEMSTISRAPGRLCLRATAHANDAALWIRTVAHRSG